MSFVPPVDFLKYLNGVTGQPANLTVTSPLDYSQNVGILSIDAANSTQGGYITNGAQDISGVKNFIDGITGNITSAGISNTTADTTIKTTYAGNSYFNFKADPTSAFDNKIRVYGLGDETTVNSENLSVGYNSTEYEISVEKQGLGVQKNLNINAKSVKCINTNDSTSTDSGALQVLGGVGIAKNLHVGGNIYGTLSTTNLTLTSTTNSTSTDSGALQVLGGAGIAKNLYVGGEITMPSKTANSIIVNGGTNGKYITDNSDANASKLKVVSPDGTKLTQVAVAQDYNVGQIYTTAGSLELWGDGWKCLDMNTSAINASYKFAVKDTTDATNHLSGSLTTAGGVGISKKLYVGDGVDVTGQSNFTTSNVAIPQIQIKYSNLHTATLLVNNLGGLQINAPLNIVTGNRFVVTATDDSIGYNSGGIQTLGGIGIKKSLYAVSTIHSDASVDAPYISATSTEDATNTTTGSLRVAGGAGIAKNLYVGGSVAIRNNGGANGNSIYTDTSNNIIISTPRWKQANMTGLLKGSGVGTPNYTLIGALPFYGYEFTTAQTMTLYGQLHIPGDVYVTTPQYVIILYWMTNSINAGNVNFTLTFNQAQPGAAHGPPDTSIQMIVASAGQYVNNRSLSTVTTMPTVVKGTQALLKVSRTIGVNDTLNASIWLTGYYYMYLSDKIIGDNGG